MTVIIAKRLLIQMIDSLNTGKENIAKILKCISIIVQVII